MRITVKPDKEYSLFSRLMFYLQKKKFGMIVAPSKIWGRSPWLFLGFNIFYAALSRKSSPLDPGLIALVNTRIAQINRCPFCIDLNSSMAHKQGITKEKIDALPDYQKNDLYLEKDRIAIMYAEAMTKTDKMVDDELFQQLKNFFNDKEIIELTAMIAFENLSSKFNAALAVPSQEFYHPKNT